MPGLDQVKRRLLREAVRENVDALRGLPPRTLRRDHRIRRAVVRGLVLIGVPTLMLIGSLATGGGERRSGIPPLLAFSGASLEALRHTGTAAFPLAVRRIVLDPGHGGIDSGARSPSGLWEKEITLDVARRLRPVLEDAGFEVVLTRERDETVSLRQRSVLANLASPDLFVSIHVNSIPTQDCRAVETYHLGPAHDSRAEQLAGAENRESGYSLADFRRLLEGVYAHVRQAESSRLAEAVQTALVGHLGRSNPAIRDNGVKRAPFLVLVATESPGVLAEVSCLAHEEEARLLADGEYRQKIARGLFLGIRQYAESHNRLARHDRAQGGTQSP